MKHKISLSLSNRRRLRIKKGFNSKPFFMYEEIFISTLLSLIQNRLRRFSRIIQLIPILVIHLDFECVHDVLNTFLF